jgi:hypothetical protein
MPPIEIFLKQLLLQIKYRAIQGYDSVLLVWGLPEAGIFPRKSAEHSLFCWAAVLFDEVCQEVFDPRGKFIRVRI